MTKRVYKNKQSEDFMHNLYDAQAAQLSIEFEDLYVETRFGKTHLMKLGNPKGKPILLFHGGNSTAPYYLRDFLALKEDYLIYAADTMGHPGKSAQTILSANNLEYGEWASDVIDSLGFQKIICMGGSYGGGVLMKLMCVAPQKIEKSILIVPSGICNVSTFSVMIKLGIPMIKYILTKSEKQLKKAILPMAIHEEEIDEDTLLMVRSTFNHVNVKAGLPSNVSEEALEDYHAPTLLLVGEKDILFPGERVVNRATTIMPHARSYIMKGNGHLSKISSVPYMIPMILDFLKEE